MDAPSDKMIILQRKIFQCVLPSRTRGAATNAVQESLENRAGKRGFGEATRVGDSEVMMVPQWTEFASVRLGRGGERCS